MNPMDLLKNLQNMQGQFQAIQARLASVRVTGTAGGDMVKITLSGQMDVISVSIAPEIVNPNEVKMLEDLILAAFTDASAKIREKIREEVSSLTGGLNIPPGFMGM
ncbi:MAG TPA: YbaB/EbfC family nucleoid-associated protein [Spirochaetia bacterium]|nr:YbaB/EbfC family nucleoid-associated protein [Spirochaetia bacterium]